MRVSNNRATQIAIAIYATLTSGSVGEFADQDEIKACAKSLRANLRLDLSKSACIDLAARTALVFIEVDGANLPYIRRAIEEGLKPVRRKPYPAHLYPYAA